MIELKNLTKIYQKSGSRKKGLSEDVLAVDHISLSIEKGSIVGLLGPNGAGKSTTIKMLLGVLYPTEGEALIDGKNTFKHRTKLMKRIGIVFGQRSQLWWDLPPTDSFELVRKMYGVEKRQFQETVEELTALLEAEELINQPVRYLSLGQRMKCELIASLCFQPDIIILDEPTIGLDIATKESIRAFLKQTKIQRNTTVLLATHDLGDVEAICDRVIVINHGKILFDDSYTEISHRQNREKDLKILCTGSLTKANAPFPCEIQQLGSKTILTLTGTTKQIMEAVPWCMENSSVEDVTISNQSIEKVVLDLYHS